MSRRSTDEVADTARRRLELLGRELARVGGGDPSAPIAHEADEVPVIEPVPGLLTGLVPEPVPEPGRHCRARVNPLRASASGWLRDRLPAPLQGRVSLGSAHVAVVAVVAALALSVTAYVALHSRSSGEPVPVAVATQASALVPSAPDDPVTAQGASPSPSAGGAAAKVVVDVAGKVRRPGIAVLPAGSRVVDAIRKAGGARKGVDLSSINLARVLVDGEQILVGVRPAAGLASSAATDPSGASSEPAGGLVNLNTATLEQLETLSGVGPVTAQKILDWRGAHGSFSSIDDLLEVDGIGEKTLAEIAPHVTL